MWSAGILVTTSHGFYEFFHEGGKRGGEAGGGKEAALEPAGA